MNPYSHIDASTQQEGRELAAGWSSAEFEAALPLYAGGDLELSEAAAVHAFVELHPERCADVEAAVEARRIFVGGAAAGVALERDLWPGIRAALHAEGWLGRKDPASQEVLVTQAVGSSALAAVTDGEAPRGRRRLALVTSGFAAAAAVALTAGLAWMLGFDGVGGGTSPQVLPEVAVTTDLGGATPAAAPALGSAPRVTYTANQELPQGVIRLGTPVGRPLEEEAIDLGFGSFHPDAGLPRAGSGGGASLVGGMPSVRPVLIVPRERR